MESSVDYGFLNDLFDKDDSLLMTSEESQKELFFPAQAGANTSMLNQTSESRLAQTDTSSEANSFGQPVTSQPQNILYTEKMVGTATNQAHKKRLTDRAYRERLKESRKKLGDELCKLREENAYLKSENESLKKDKDMMNGNLQSATDETKQLKSEICMLKHNISHQQILVDAFSQRLINNDHRVELTQLKSKIAILSQNSNWDDWMTEKEQLLERIVNLERQNKLLSVQVEALCEMIHNEKDNGDKVTREDG